MNKVSMLMLMIFYAGCFTPKLYTINGRLNEKRSISKIIDKSNLNTNIGIKAISLKTGKILFDLNSGSLFNPASNNKLYTAIAALALLDTGYTFKTSVFLEGNTVYLVGGGDPDLKISTLDSLASIISKKIPSANELILDDTITDSLVYGPGWMWDEGDEWYSAEISALSVNDNCIDFIISPSSTGSLINVEIYPKSNFYNVKNEGTTVSDTSEYEKLKISRDWQNNKNSFHIYGTILDTTSIDTLTRNISNPTLFTGNLFKELLLENGLRINKSNKGSNPSTSKLIATHHSKPLIVSLENLMVESDNLTAELLVKIIGHETTKKQGSWQNGLLAMRTFFNDDVGIDTTTFSISDGSGVSRYNYSSASHLTDLLLWAYGEPDIKDSLLKILSTTNEGATLKDRNLPKGVYAKTGSLSGVTTFSGYILNDPSDPIAFSILMNGFKGSSSAFRALQDEIVTYLSKVNQL